MEPDRAANVGARAVITSTVHASRRVVAGRIRWREAHVRRSRPRASAIRAQRRMIGHKSGLGLVFLKSV